MLRFSANLGMLFTEVSYLERFARAAEAGFDTVEIWTLDAPIAEVEQVLADTRLTLLQFNLTEGDPQRGEVGLLCVPEAQGRFRADLERALDVAGELGVRQLNCPAGNRSPDHTAETQLECMRANLEWAAPRLAARSIHLNIEPLNAYRFPDYIFPRSRPLFALLREWALPQIGLQYDIFHMQLMEGNLVQTLRENLPLVGHIQVGDVPDRHQPGTGEIAYRYVFQQLEAAGYAGYIGLEYVPLGTTEQSLSWLATGQRVTITASELRL